MKKINGLTSFGMFAPQSRRRICCRSTGRGDRSEATQGGDERKIGSPGNRSSDRESANNEDLRKMIT